MKQCKRKSQKKTETGRCVCVENLVPIDVCRSHCHERIYCCHGTSLSPVNYNCATYIILTTGYKFKVLNGVITGNLDKRGARSYIRSNPSRRWTVQRNKRKVDLVEVSGRNRKYWNRENFPRPIQKFLTQQTKEKYLGKCPKCIRPMLGSLYTKRL